MSRLIIIGGRRPVAVEFLGLSAEDASFANSILVSGFDFGAAADGLKIVVVAHFFSAVGADPQITGGTIDGVSISTIKDVTSVSSSVADFGAWLVGVELPGGGTGDISLTFSDSVFCRLAVYRVTNAGLVPTDTGQQVWTGTTTTPQDANADVDAGGAFFGATTAWLSGGTVTLSGVTPDYATRITTDSDYRISCGFEVLSSATLAKTASVARSGGAGNWHGALATASLR